MQNSKPLEEKPERLTIHLVGGQTIQLNVMAGWRIVPPSVDVDGNTRPMDLTFNLANESARHPEYINFAHISAIEAEPI